MLSETLETARRVESAMRGIYEQTAIDFYIYVTKINSEGVKFV
jgi:homoserine kinase